MANIIPIGIDEETGQMSILNPSVDLIINGTLDTNFNAYVGGDISVGTGDDVAFVDVDAVNAKLDFTASASGKYFVSFYFNFNITGSTGLGVQSETIFRLTDGAIDSPPISLGIEMPGVALFSSGIKMLGHIFFLFPYASPGQKSIKLQKRNITSSNVNSRLVAANSNSVLRMSVYRLSDYD